jgi:hypothetical protein
MRAQEGRSMAKKKWCDGVYFMAQDRCMEDAALRPNRATHRLAIMGFVRTTCVRAGSIARDWFDRAGLAARWVGVNVMSVEHYEWDREGFRIVLPDGSVEVRADAPRFFWHQERADAALAVCMLFVCVV